MNVSWNRPEGQTMLKGSLNEIELNLFVEIAASMV